ncbi:hypothetical protein DER29_4252 [Micromonospora sp. M71_S20]|uniref:hypothetical protein n=1 Tax=Micromonospora sp. M71_S20 TaxID=592872 RepID=UPI000EACA173|nr:hypothetical protein [Micromonospora sp. M71_S20]RLK13235.1 hypothetical protein DER29_4252 [Micromonospora sp. M71_S20]
MTTSPVRNGAPIGRATFADDPVLLADVLRPYAGAKTRYLESATVIAANGLASAEGEFVQIIDMPWRFRDDNGGIAEGDVRMALVDPPGMRLAADAA